MNPVELDSEQAMRAFGARLAHEDTRGAVIFLRGPLGAGKTTLVRGMLNAMGHQGPVRSPTFTLLEPYTVGAREFVHLDLYRLSDPEELEMLGLRDFLDSASTMLIEWPEQGAGVVPPEDLAIEIEYAGEGRRLALQAATGLGRRVAKRIAGETAQVP